MALNQFAGDLSADRFTVKKLLDLARAGSLRIPPFQRGLRWRRSDHRLLLDSLYRRYPVGTLLLWRRHAAAATVVYGGFSVAAPDESNAYWIVDGQQRIACLAGCLLQPDDQTGRGTNEFAFLFDLEQEKFVDAAGQSAPHLVPVNQLHDPVQTAIWARTHGVSDELHRAAQRVGSRLLGYEIPTYVTTAESDDLLRTIFARANTAGRKMRDVEVFEALNRGLNPDKSPAGLTDRLQRVLYALDFGSVKSDDLRKSLIYVAGHNPREKLPDALKEPGAAAKWEGSTAEALRRTVEFLRDAAKIPHAQMLPYALPLIVLPRFFHLFPNPRERSIELLVRWVWRGIAGEAHMATNQNFNPLFRALKNTDEEEVIQKFLALAGRRQPAELPESKVYNPRGMRTRLELAVLFTRGPRHLLSGQLLSPVEIFEDTRPEQPLLFQEASPKSQERPAGPAYHLPSVSADKQQFPRSVAARFLHPDLGHGEAFSRRLSQASSEILTSHAIPGDQQPAARNCDWDEVVSARERVIQADVRRTIEQLARWDEDGDGPSIEACIADHQANAIA